MSTCDLATSSGRRGALLYKGVLTKVLSASYSENSAEICLWEAAFSEYIFLGKYLPV